MRKIVSSMLVFVTMVANAQLNTAYFQKLQSQRVVSSDTIQWTQFGPGMSGYCEAFWCHPTNDSVMFMSPDMYNSYGSWDGGKSWQTIKDCDGTGWDMRRIQSINFSSQNPDFGHAIDVRGYLYKTTDRGHNWTKILELGGRCSEMTVDPSNDQNWYIGAGDFWNVKANWRSAANTLGVTYAYAQYGYITKSTDGGKTWTKKTSGLPSTLDVGRIIVDPTDSKIIIAATNSGIYRSTNQGETWALSGTGLPNNLPRDMTSYYNKADNEFILYMVEQTVYEPSGTTITSKGGVYKSTDHGVTWTSVSGNLAFDLTKVTAYTTRDYYYNAVGFWLGKTKSEAKTLYPTYPASVYPVFNRLRVNPLNKNELYVTYNVKHDKSFGIGDVWKTNDGGNTWISTARTGKYWTGKTDNAYWLTRQPNDLGMNTTFAHLQDDMASGFETAGNRFLELNSKGDVFICIDQQVLRSNDHGKTWLQVDDNETAPGSKTWVGRGGSNLPGRFMLLETGIAKRYLFCSGEHGLWQTEPLGGYADNMAIPVKQIEGQVNSSGATSIASVAVDPKNPNIIYILMFRQDHQGYLRRSTDGGKTWANVSKPVNYTGNLSSDMMFQYSLMVDYSNSQNIYFVMPQNAPSEVSNTSVPAAFTDFGVYRSKDAGKTWAIVNNGFPANSSVHRIIMDPATPTTLYAALNYTRSVNGSAVLDGGLYKSVNQGDNWTKMTIPSAIKSVNNVFLDRNNRYMYISCGRYEGTFADGGVWRSKDEGTTWEKIFEMPFIYQTETSPLNPNLITVSVGGTHEVKSATPLNPGAYISYNGGAGWTKVNRNLGQPNDIVDFKPDPFFEGVYWCALKGSGWAVGYTKGMTRGWTELYSATPKTMVPEIEKISLYPNPSQNLLHITFNVEPRSCGPVQLFSIDGKQVLNMPNASNKQNLQVPVNTLACGTYFVKTTINGVPYTKRFIKN